LVLSIKPSVSVVMPVFNGLPYLKQQITTILSQMEIDDELLIIDDLSTDGTLEYLQSVKLHSNKNIKIIQNKKNRGILPNIKELLLKAKSNIVIFADQDDIWYSHKILLTRKFFEDDELSLCIHDAKYLCEDASDQLNNKTAYQHLKISKSLLKNLIRNRFIGCCMAINRTHYPSEIIDRIPKTPMHDWFLSSYALMKKKKVIIVNESLIEHRRHARNFTRSDISFFEKIRQRLRLVKEIGL